MHHRTSTQSHGVWAGLLLAVMIVLVGFLLQVDSQFVHLKVPGIIAGSTMAILLLIRGFHVRSRK